IMPSENNLIEALQCLDDKSFNNEAGRLRAVEALTLAVSKIQRPWDIVWQHCWVNPATTACTKTLIDAGVFAKWVEAGGGDKTCAELAELTKTDPVLIRRLIRQISGQNLVIETAEDTYKPTPW
ncbi:hypothetical protein FOPG_19376, partial [Fusarium oxysporum f. sp. conglutinans race 2 54008]